LDGVGASLDLSLYETAVSFMGYHLAGYSASGVVPGRNGTAVPSLAPYQAFEAADGALMIAADNDRIFASLCRAVGLTELADDPRFATNAERVASRDELAARLQERIRSERRTIWLDRFAAAGVPAAPVQDVREMAEHPQTAAVELVRELGGLPIAALPVSVDGARVTHVSPAPPLGGDTEDVLREAGYSTEAIRELAESGVVGLGG